MSSDGCERGAFSAVDQAAIVPVVWCGVGEVGAPVSQLIYLTIPEPIANLIGREPDCEQTPGFHWADRVPQGLGAVLAMLVRGVV